MKGKYLSISSGPSAVDQLPNFRGADAGGVSVDRAACADAKWSGTQRDAAIANYSILDTEREAAFDDIAELAADLLSAPISVVNFITSERQWFKAEVGIGQNELPLDVSICKHAILESDLLVVPDLHDDARFVNNPLVNVKDGLRFYAGALLRTSSGVPLGTICVLDTVARPNGIDDRQTRALKALAAQTMAQLELRQTSARAERHSLRLTQLAAASAHLVSATDAKLMVINAYTDLSKAIPLDICFQYLCSETELNLVASVGLNEEQERLAAKLEFGQTICGIVAETGNAMHVTNIQTSDNPDASFLRMLGIDTYYSIPLVNAGQLFGTMSFGRRGSAFTPGELEVLSTLAAQAGIALERQQNRLEYEVALRQRVDEAVGAREVALQQLHELQKTETIGQLSSGIAHDFNNLLTPIVGSLDLLHRKYGDDARTVRLISGAQQSAERARVLISRLLTFARRQHLEERPVDIGRLINGMIDMVSRTIGPQISIAVEIEQDISPVKVDPNQFELALLNLCVNARDAMPDGGALTIATNRVDNFDDETVVLSPGDYVRVSVKDTGLGMTPDTLRRAAEPFFSTKGVGKGTGLGLSMVHGLAAQSGGAIRIVSAPNEGTTICIWLPVALNASIQANDMEASVSITPITSKHILLVDDEELVLRGNAAMLEDLGHIVTRASSGAAALQHLTNGADCDLLLTDHMMPSMTGVELVAASRALRPNLPAALLTGYTDVLSDRTQISRLAKPFRLADLAQLVADVTKEQTDIPV